MTDSTRHYSWDIPLCVLLQKHFWKLSPTCASSVPYLTSTLVDARWSCFLVSRELDLVGELIIETGLRLLGKGVLGDGEEGLLHINRFLRTCLVVGDVILWLAPMLRPFSRNLQTLHKCHTGCNKYQQYIKENNKSEIAIFWKVLHHLVTY